MRLFKWKSCCKVKWRASFGAKMCFVRHVWGQVYLQQRNTFCNLKLRLPCPSLALGSSISLLRSFIVGSFGRCLEPFKAPHLLNNASRSRLRRPLCCFTCGGALARRRQHKYAEFLMSTGKGIGNGVWPWRGEGEVPDEGDDKGQGNKVERPYTER